MCLTSKASTAFLLSFFFCLCAKVDLYLITLDLLIETCSFEKHQIPLKKVFVESYDEGLPNTRKSNNILSFYPSFEAEASVLLVTGHNICFCIR